MQLFYKKDISEHKSHQYFDPQESKHICRVLRKKEGDHLYVTDGIGNLFEINITFANPQQCEFEIFSQEKKARLRDFKISLAVAPTKNNDRYEWFVEKTCEMGVDHITPILCKFSERKHLNTERLEKIAINAMKQSGQFFLPQISELTDFNKLVSLKLPQQRFIAFCSEDSTKDFLSKLIQPSRDVLILVGPEGDFSKEEIQEALKNNFIPISLGGTRLRTETAAIVACNIIHVKNEVF